MITTNTRLPTATDPAQAEGFSGYPVKITIFEGPLDLLLHLVRCQQVDIHQVQIASITDQYLEYLHTMQAVNIEVAGEFLVMAATLLLLKSRALLPASEADDEDEQEELGDTEAELKRRLAEYKVYKEAAQLLDESRRARQRIFLRPAGKADEIVRGFVPLNEVSVFDLIGAVKEMLQRAQPPRPARLAPVTVTVSQRVEEIIFRLAAEPNTPLHFRDLVDVPTSRLHIIVTFLAVLELIRQGRIRIYLDSAARNLMVKLADQQT